MRILPRVNEAPFPCGNKISGVRPSRGTSPPPPTLASEDTLELANTIPLETESVGEVPQLVIRENFWQYTPHSHLWKWLTSLLPGERSTPPRNENTPDTQEDTLSVTKNSPGGNILPLLPPEV